MIQVVNGVQLKYKINIEAEYFKSPTKLTSINVLAYAHTAQQLKISTRPMLNLSLSYYDILLLGTVHHLQNVGYILPFIILVI